MNIYEMGSRLEYDNGDFIQLPGAAQIQVVNKGESSQLRTFIRIHTGGKGTNRVTTSPLLHVTPMQHIRIRSMLMEKVSETGYRPNDFCIVGDVALEHSSWSLQGNDIQLVEAAHVKVVDGILQIVVLNRPILYTDGVHWFSGTAQLVPFQNGVQELVESLDYQQGSIVSGTIGRKGDKRGIFVWSPRRKDSRMANDILAEINRVFPKRIQL
jgi:hypothetical protein